ALGWLGNNISCWRRSESAESLKTAALLLARLLTGLLVGSGLSTPSAPTPVRGLILNSRLASRLAGGLSCARRQLGRGRVVGLFRSSARCRRSRLAGPCRRPRPDVHRPACLQVQTSERSILRFGVYGVVICRVYLDVEPVAAAYSKPLGIGNSLP